MAKTGYIYKYTFPNGKVYIGQTMKSIEETQQQQLMTEPKDPKKRTLLQLVKAKYGQPELEVLECFKVGDNNIEKLAKLLNEAEKNRIDIYDTTLPPNGYNWSGTVEEFILEEKRFEMIGKRIDLVFYCQRLLPVIGNKICITMEQLTKEECDCFYGCTFMDYTTGEETTFSLFYNQRRNDKIYDNCIASDIKLKLKDNNPSQGDIEKTRKEIEKLYFDIIIESAIDDHLKKYISDTVNELIDMNKDIIINKWFKDIKN